MGTGSLHSPTRQPPSVDDVVKRRRPLRNVHRTVLEEKITPLDRLALWITVRVGSMGFFLIIFAWTALWLGWNLLVPRAWQFDPPMAFVFWLFISNVIQILLMPLIWSVKTSRAVTLKHAPNMIWKSTLGRRRKSR